LARERENKVWGKAENFLDVEGSEAELSRKDSVKRVIFRGRNASLGVTRGSSCRKRLSVNETMVKNSRVHTYLLGFVQQN